MVDIKDICEGCKHFLGLEGIYLCYRNVPETLVEGEDPLAGLIEIEYDEDLCEEAQEKLSKLKQQEAGKK